METFDVQGLYKLLSEVVSFTSDMGTEIKVCDFCFDRLTPADIMPGFLAARVGTAPLQEGVGEDDDAHGDCRVQCDGQEIFRNGIPIPGHNNLIHSIVKDSAKNMKQCTKFFE